MENILLLNNISRAFPGVQALDDVSFAVQKGTVHALVGENGAGKSTLMKILAGALAPDSGSIIYSGAPFSPASPCDSIRAGISTIYQEFNLLSLRSVSANVTLGMEPARLGVLQTRVAKELVARTLAQLNASHIPVNAQVGWLKVSEKQIVEIAKALMRECRLLIMDEPTASLSASEAQALFDIIQRLREQGVTILYISHRLEEIFSLADNVTVLRDGRHILTAPVAEVTTESLITAMIGRKVEGIFPPKNQNIGDEILRVEHLSSGNLFSDVSFSLHAGEVVAITGLTGSGKTEIGKALFGDMHITSGKVYFSKKEVRPNPANALACRIGYMPEDRKREGLLEELSIQRNIALPILDRITSLLGVIKPGEERKAAQTQVDNLHIRTPSLRQVVRNLSGGNQQKVSLGKWLATGSETLILMEPTQGIDIAVKFEIYNLIARLSAEGVGILLVSSEMQEVLGLAHRIIVMCNGTLMANLDGGATNSEEILQFMFGQKKEALNG